MNSVGGSSESVLTRLCSHPNWLAEYPLMTPPTVAPILYARHAGYLNPLRNALVLPLKSNEVIFSSISRLFNAGGPAAVFLAVAQCVVNAVNAVLCRWTRPHVVIEGLKGLPFSAHGNASAAVVLVHLFVRVFASSKNSAPDFIFCGFGHAVRCLSGRNKFTLKASAGLCSQRSEFSQVDVDRAAAIASAKPVNPLALESHRILGNKSAKALASDIFCVPVKMYNSVSHIGTRFINVVRGQGVDASCSRYFTPENAPTKAAITTAYRGS